MNRIPASFLVCFALLILSGLAACSQDDDPLPTVTTCPDLTLGDVDSIASNIATISEAYLDENGCLALVGRYSGGCVDDDLRVNAILSLALIYPPQYFVTMYDAADDSCDALEEGSIAVDLAAIRNDIDTFDMVIYRPDTTIIVPVRS